MGLYTQPDYKLEEVKTLDQEKEIMLEKLRKIDENEFILNKIKAKRKVVLREGDIFVLEPIKNYFLFGRIIRAGDENSKIGRIPDAAVVFIFSKGFDSFKNVPEEFDYSDILIGPEIVEKGYWTRGWFYTVKNVPLSKKEKNLKYCFYDLNRASKKVYYDEMGNRLDDKPETTLISRFGINTSIGILYSIKEAWILRGEFELSQIETMENG